jgi:ATP-binding cassette subfamily G (WHITE) protein 2
VPSSSKKGEVAVLLDDVTGFFQQGQLAALLGPSGSGKTTLLDILSGRKTTGNIQGQVKFGGALPSRAFLRRYTAFVEQFGEFTHQLMLPVWAIHYPLWCLFSADTLIPSFTVEEMLLYTSYLKCPKSESHETKVNAVNSLLEKLGLDSCRGVKIGDPLSKGISGGQVIQNLALILFLKVFLFLSIFFLKALLCFLLHRPSAWILVLHSSPILRSCFWMSPPVVLTLTRETTCAW